MSRPKAIDASLRIHSQPLIARSSAIVVTGRRAKKTTLPSGQAMKLVFFRDPEGNRIELTQRG